MRLNDLSQAYRRFVRRNSADAPSREAWRRLRRNPLAVASLAVIGLFVLVALLGYLITPDHTPNCNQQYLELATLKPGSHALFAYYDQRPAPKQSLLGRMLHGTPLPYTALPVANLSMTTDSVVLTPIAGEPFAIERSRFVGSKNRTFLLGTDNYGRDMLSLLMIGSRVSLSVGLIAILIALLVGISLGSIAGYRGGQTDSLIMWLINVVWSIPTVLLVIAITFALGKGFWQVFVAVGLTMWVDIARVVRGQVLSVKEKDYIQAALALGYRTPRIVLRHILPNIAGPVVVVAASNFASAILLEAGLSFLGIGVQPPTPSWGSMVKEYYGYILLDSAYMPLLPGVAIMLIVLAFMLLADALRDALDTRQQ